MKALIVKKQAGQWLLALGCWLLACAANGDNHFPHGWETPTESMACGLSCPSDITVSTDFGFCDAIVFYTVTITDPGTCLGPLVQLGGLPSGANFPLGATLNSFEIEAPGGFENCSFTVTVEDNEAPNIFTCSDPPACTILSPGCPFPVFVNNDPGLCTAVVTWEPVIVQDNCPGAVIVSSHAPGSVFPTGFTTVTYTATDAAGNSSACNFDVFVDDIEPPLMTCPDITWVPTLAFALPWSILRQRPPTTAASPL